ncbi:MAG: 50S ribosomal protein L21 [bacterium]|nr:50S ribosomal protein L21 [bacterium]
MKAIIKTGGKQYLVEEGSTIFVEKLDAKEGKNVVFEEVLMLDGNIGTPFVSGASVTGKVVKHGKNKKIRIFKYVNKNKSTRKTQGHRQPYTKVEITKING